MTLHTGNMKHTELSPLLVWKWLDELMLLPDFCKWRDKRRHFRNYVMFYQWLNYLEHKATSPWLHHPLIWIGLIWIRALNISAFTWGKNCSNEEFCSELFCENVQLVSEEVNFLMDKSLTFYHYFLQERLGWSRPGSCPWSQHSLPSGCHCLLRGETDLAFLSWGWSSVVPPLEPPVLCTTFTLVVLRILLLTPAF